ncbi:hypothetical protein WUBG_06626 [Wuchereria bancrofti]|uniref:Uncharacterized protein n=1 Tax=Wuchereria bancrofti TaxID=6293 RepID=J9EJT6_WUCBA|nr:hypothetical protein WUBG_06626 [Wuchereria bancrofti]
MDDKNLEDLLKIDDERSQGNALLKSNNDLSYSATRRSQQTGSNRFQMQIQEDTIQHVDTTMMENNEELEDNDDNDNEESEESNDEGILSDSKNNDHDEDKLNKRRERKNKIKKGNEKDDMDENRSDGVINNYAKYVS